MTEPDNRRQMTDPEKRNVTRPRDPPLADEIIEEMVPNHCYVVADLVNAFQEQYDPARGTVRNRMEELAADGRIERRKHVNGTVTYRRPGARESNG